MAITGGGTLDGYTLTNEGTAAWSGGTIAINDGATFANPAGSTFDAQADGTFIWNAGAAPAFVNGGTLEKSAGGGGTGLLLPIQSTGVVEVDTGTLRLGRNGTNTWSGTLTGLPGTTLDFFENGHTFTDASINADHVVFGDGSAALGAGVTYHANSTTATNDETLSFAGPVAGIGGLTVVNGSAVTFQGSVSNLGDLNVDRGSAVTFAPTPASFTVPSLELGGTLTGPDSFLVNGLFTWSGGTLSDSEGDGSLTAAGGMAITGGGTLDGWTLTNQGTAIWTGGNIAINDGATFANPAGSTFDAQADGTFIWNTGAAPAFVNGGTIKKSAGVGITALALPIQSTGAVEVDTGSLWLGRTGTNTWSGTLTGLTGTTLEFVEGPQTFSSAASINADHVVFYAGSAAVAAGVSYQAHSTTVTGDETLSFAGSVASIGDLTVVSSSQVTFSGSVGNLGDLNIDSSSAVTFPTTPASFTVPSLELGGTLTGPDSFLVNGLFTWSGGTLSDGEGDGSLTAAGGMAITGGGTLDGWTLTNKGTAAWTGGDIAINDGATFNNPAGSTFDAQGDGTLIYNSGAVATFVNGGTLEKTAGVGTTGLLLPIQSTGPVEVDTGTLRLGRNATSTAPNTWSGTLTGLPGTTLDFFENGHTFTDASINADHVVFDAGSATWTGGAGVIYQAQSTTATDGETLSFAGPVASIGDLTVNAGSAVTFQGSVGNLGDLNVDSSSAVTFPSAPASFTVPSLELGGTLTGPDSFLVNGLFTWGGGTLSDSEGAGSLTAAGGMAITGGTLDGWTVTNQGTATWTGGTIAINDGATFNNPAGSIFDAQADGTFIWNAGSAPAFVNGGTLEKSAGFGTTNLLLPVQSTGTVEVDTGTLRLGRTGTNTWGGTLTGLTGTTLDFVEGPQTFASGSVNADRVVFEGGTAAVGAGVTYQANSTTATDGETLSFAGSVAGIGDLTAVDSQVDFTSTTPVTTTATSVVLSSGILTGNGDLLLNDSGNYSQDAGSTLSVTIGGPTAGAGYDQIQAAGGITLDGALNVSLVGGYVPSAGQTFTLIQGQGSGSSISGTFAGLPDGAIFGINSTLFQINYQGGAVVLTALGAVYDPTLANPSQNLQTAIDTQLQTSSSATTLPIRVATSLDADNVLNAVAGLVSDQFFSASNPVTVALSLQAGTYSGMSINVPDGVVLVINGLTTNQLPTTVDPGIPALTVTSGKVIVNNVTFTESGDAPTILVTGGSLTLRKDVVQESTGFSDAAIQVTGGTLDLGTSASPGGNTININGAGRFVLNTGPNLVTAVGDTFTVNGATAAPLTVTTLTSSAPTSLLNQPVTLTATVRASVPGAGTPSGTVYFRDLTTGVTLGSAPLSGGTTSLKTSALAVGSHTIVAVYGGDATFVTSYGTASQAVTYKFSGFLAPLNSNLTFGLNRVIPIKFQLTDYKGKFITSLGAITSLQVLNAKGVNVLTNAGSTALRYDATANQFVANWQTKGLPAGTYTVQLQLADGTTQTKTVQLTANGSGPNAQATDGSDVSAGSTAGQLLGGDLEVYVDNSNGDLTPNELARIQDAITAVDAVTVPYGVTVAETADPSQAAVTLDMAATSPVGGHGDGILGCFDPAAGQITLIQGWNWYAGSDPTQIGAGQYDFQTTLTHELGHALGLGESGDATSAMHGTLAPGTAIRTLTTADLNLPYDEAGADAQRAAVPPSVGADNDAAEAAPTPLPHGGAAPELATSDATPGAESVAGMPGGRQAERSAVDPRQLVVADNAVPAVTAAPTAGAGAVPQAIPTGLVAWNQGAQPAPATPAGRGGSADSGEVQAVAAPLAGDWSAPAGEPVAGKERTASDRPQLGEQTALPERRASVDDAAPDGSEGVSGTLTDEPGDGQGEVQGSKDLTILSPLLALLGVCRGAQGADQPRKHPRQRQP
jgi:hypothetical protein